MKAYCVLAWLLLPLCGYGQGIYFNARYPNGTTAYQSWITSLAVTDSGYVTFGQASDYPIPGAYSLMLRGLNPQGGQRWVRYFGQAGYDYYGPGFGNGEALALADGGFVMAGSVNAPARQQWPMLWRFTAQGDTLWTRSYRQALGGVAYAGCRTADGGYALVGSLGRSGGSGVGSRGLLIRTDSAGNFQGMTQYGTVYATGFLAIFPTRDSGFLLSGYAWNGDPINLGVVPFVVKSDSLGLVQWEHTFGNPLMDNSGGMARPTTDGGYLVAATRYAGVVGSSVLKQPVLYKLDSAGQTIWQRTLGPARAVSAFVTIHELADGSFVLAGQQDDGRARSSTEGFAAKICADGDSLWWRTYKKLPGGSSANYLRDFQPTPDGGFVGAGFLFARPPDPGNNDSWVFRVDSAGYLAPHGPPVTARCQGVVTGGGKAPADEDLALFPNPAPDGRFSVRAPRGSRLTVADALGRVVWRGESTGGETAVDLSHRAPGLYLLRATTPDRHTLVWKLAR